jgi:predicted MFS family arabinose efflux permease
MSGLTTATVLAVWLGVPAGDLFSDIGWAVAASVTLFVSSLVYLYRSWYGMRVGHGEPRTLER